MSRYSVWLCGVLLIWGGAVSVWSYWKPLDTGQWSVGRLSEETACTLGPWEQYCIATIIENNMEEISYSQYCINMVVTKNKKIVPEIIIWRHWISGKCWVAIIMETVRQRHVRPTSGVLGTNLTAERKSSQILFWLWSSRVGYHLTSSVTGNIELRLEKTNDS